MASLDYQSSRPPQQSPTDYEHAYEQERGRWFRRRLVFYSITSLILTLGFSAFAIAFTQPGLDGLQYLALTTSLMVAVAMLIIACRIRPVARTVLRVAFIYYVFTNLWGVCISYLEFGSSNSQFDTAFENGFNAGQSAARRNAEPGHVQISAGPDFGGNAVIISTGDGDDATAVKKNNAATKPSFITGRTDSYIDPMTLNFGSRKFRTTGPKFRQLVKYSAIYVSLLIKYLINFLVVCLFIPWTFREAIRPAAIVIGATLLTNCVDLLLGTVPWQIFLIVSFAMVITIVPGATVCWWRYTRFNKTFRLRFESKRYRQLEADLGSARKVHEAFLAQPRFEGPVRMNYVYEPMRQIGGDLLVTYPNSPTEPIRYVILLDVTGHGVAAALSVNRIIGEVERLLAENQQQGVVALARSLNRYVNLTLGPRNLFVTGLLLEIDHAENSLTCVNAGHPTAYHICAATKALSPIESNAMMLGVLGGDDFEVEPTTIAFESGDAIFGYTDGANEAANHDGRLFGLVGVKQQIATAIGQDADPAAWPEFVRNRIIDYRQAPPQDDTILFTLWRA